MDPKWKRSTLDATIGRVGPAQLLVVGVHIGILVHVVIEWFVVDGGSNIEDEDPVAAGYAELARVFNLVVVLKDCLVAHMGMVVFVVSDVVS